MHPLYVSRRGFHRTANIFIGAVADRRERVLAKIPRIGASQSHANIIPERIKRLTPARPAPTSRLARAHTMAKLILKYCQAIGRSAHFSVSERRRAR